MNPFTEKINRERPLSRGSLRSREKREEPVTGEMRRNAAFGGTQGAEEHRRTQGWQRPHQVAMLPSAGDDFEACLFAQTSFGFARPIRSIEKGLVETVAALTREPRS